MSKVKPETYSDRFRAINAALGRMGNWLMQDKSTWCRQEHERFVAVGGCKACHGRGWYVAWDTLDSLSGCYAEYGACKEPGCTEETRKATGLDLSYDDKYNKLRGVDVPRLRELDPSYVALTAATEKEYARLLEKLRLTQYACEPKKGDKVIVTRGRPKDKQGNVMPVGTISFVAYAKEGRCLLKLDWEDRAADGTWTTSHNLEVCVEEGK